MKIMVQLVSRVIRINDSVEKGHEQVVAAIWNIRKMKMNLRSSFRSIFFYHLIDPVIFIKDRKSMIRFWLAQVSYHHLIQ